MILLWGKTRVKVKMIEPFRQLGHSFLLPGKNLDIFRNGKPAKEGVSIGFHLVFEVIKSINITFALQL